MKITAIDLVHKKFGHSLRGYKTTDVDDLVREIASELEANARDRAKLEDQIELMRSEVSSYKEMESTLNSTMLLAQRTADELRANAYREADLVVREAENRSKEISQTAYTDRVEVMNECRRLEERRDLFVDALRGAGRDLLEWIEHRRWEEVINMKRETMDEIDQITEALESSLMLGTITHEEATDADQPQAATKDDIVANEAMG
ncbi:MAG: DivIVA domain-containing protein [Armatimonadota bacterium]